MNPSPGTSWEVKARAHQCAATQTPFEEGQHIVSRLTKTPDGLAREDFAMDQWDDAKKEASLFYWKTVYHAPVPKKEAPFREDNAAEALQALMEENNPENSNTLFILAAMLERKRLWIEKAVQTDDQGQKIRIYEQKDGGETYFIVDPNIALDDLADLQEEVALKLGWIQPESEVASEPEGEAEETEAPEEVSEKDEASEREEEEGFDDDEFEDDDEDDD